MGVGDAVSVGELESVGVAVGVRDDTRGDPSAQTTPPNDSIEYRMPFFPSAITENPPDDEIEDKISPVELLIARRKA